MFAMTAERLPEGSGEPPAEDLSSDRHDLPQDAVVESQRTRILEGMAECCAERGYPATTISDIVDRAGVSRATFYELFRSKEDCFIAGANMILGDVITVTTSAYSPDKPLVHVVRDAAAAILELMATQPAAAQMTFVESRTATPKVQGLYQSGVKVLISLLDQIRVDATSETPLPSSAARSAIGGAEALLRREVAGGRAREMEQLLPQVLYSCLVPFLGQDEALRQAGLSRNATEA